MDSRCVGGQTFSKRRMVQTEQIAGGQAFSLWRIVQVGSFLTYNGLVLVTTTPLYCLSLLTQVHVFRVSNKASKTIGPPGKP
jgi:hypothetical protein